MEDYILKLCIFLYATFGIPTLLNQFQLSVRYHIKEIGH